MPRENRHTYTFKGYRLISTYLKLQQMEAIDRVYNEAFNRRLKGFHIFCVILFSAFLLDGLLPSREYTSQLIGTKVVDRTEQKIMIDGAAKIIPVPSTIELFTPEGSFTTHDIGGYEVAGAEILIRKSFMFRTKQSVCFKESNTYAYHYINFHGNFIFWPLFSLIISLVFIFIKRFYGSNTLSVIALLNLVPFFATLYMA